MRFEATLGLHGKTATGFEVPDEIVEGLEAGGRPPVRVTIGGHIYRSTIARRGDRYLLGVSAENRELAGIAAGDRCEVEIELDTAPRETAVPADFGGALDAVPEARAFFDGLTPTQRGYFVTSIEDATKPETRRKRIEKSVASLRAGRKR